MCVTPNSCVTEKLDSSMHGNLHMLYRWHPSSANLYLPCILELHETICSWETQKVVASSAEGLITPPHLPMREQQVQSWGTVTPVLIKMVMALMLRGQSSTEVL